MKTANVIERDGPDNHGQSVGWGIYLTVLSDGSRSISKKMIRME